MIRLLFLSYGHIAEPPMAAYIMTHLVREARLADRIIVASATLAKLPAPLCREAQALLEAHHIPMEEDTHFSLEWKSYDDYDFILLMNTAQSSALFNTLGGDVDEKFHLLSEYAACPMTLSNPYETHRFAQAFMQEQACCQGLLEKLENWIR